MRIPQPGFAGSNSTIYNNAKLKKPGTPADHSTALTPHFNVQRTETFTKTLRFSGTKPFIDRKGDEHTYLPDDMDENQLPDADAAFKLKSGREKYNALCNAFATAAFIGDARMVAIFLLKNYDPKLRKSTPGIHTVCKPGSRYIGSSIDDPTYRESRWWADGFKGKTILELAELRRHPEIVQMIQALRDKTMSEWATEDPKRYRELEQMLSATANPSPPKTGKQKEVEQVPDAITDPTLPETSKRHRIGQLLRQIPHPHLHR